MKLQNLKKMLSKLDLNQIFKISFFSMIALVILNAICLVKNITNHNFGMCILNAIIILGVGYHSLLVLVAIRKKSYQKNVLYLIGIDLCSIAAYILCPLYVIIAFLSDQSNFILPIGLIAVLLHFFILPTIRSWLE